MVRYHISPKTQRPNKCTAREGRCPLGGGEEVPHFPTKEAAKAHVEAQEAARHEGSSLGTVKKPSPGKKDPASPQGEVPLLRETISSLPTWKSTTREALLQEQMAFLREDSPFLCSSCQAPYSQLQAAELASSYVECSSCGEAYDIVSATLVVEEEQFADVLEDTDRVKKRLWVHATQRKGWGEAVDSYPAVHLGAPEAAIDRAFTMIGSQAKRPWDFYLVEVQEEAVVDPEVTDDANEDLLLNPSLLAPGTTTVVYENRWEGSGTLSLETRGNTVKVVGKETYSLEALKRVKGLHSVEEEALRRVKEEAWRARQEEKAREGERLRKENPRPFMALADDEVRALQETYTVRKNHLQRMRKNMKVSSDSWFHATEDLQAMEVTLGNLQREAEARGW